MKKVLIAGLAGGVVMFLWGFVSHEALPLGEMPIRTITNEDVVIGALKTHLNRPGFYLIPGEGMMSPEAKDPQSPIRREEKYRRGPTAVMFYHPDGKDPSLPTLLMTEFTTNLVSCLLAAWFVSCAAASLRSYVSRVLFITLLGLFAFIVVNVPYWNWYRFTDDFTLVEMVIRVGGFALVGAVQAAIVKPPAA